LLTDLKRKEMGKLMLEVDYKSIFSPKTVAALRDKSKNSARELLGNKDLMQAMMKSQKLFQEIVQAEEGYRDELEMVAVQMVTDAYPIVDYANIKIDAKIVAYGELDLQSKMDQEEEQNEDPSSPDFGEDDPEKMKAKRRIINGITQGASVRGAFGFMLYREYLDAINPELVAKYAEILKLAFGIYDNDDAIAMMLMALSQKMNMQGGESEMTYNDETEQFEVLAQAVCFPMLVHEIIKGLYEIVGTQGGGDRLKNQAIINQVDKLENEPEDIRYGKYIYDAITKVYNDSPIEDRRVRELFFTELYKLSDDEFFPFVENAINGELSKDQLKWANDTMKDIDSDLKKDDTGLEDLDENKTNKVMGRIEKLVVNAQKRGSLVKEEDAKHNPYVQQLLDECDRVIAILEKGRPN
jgi:hypothetical protein